jgi:predicted O-linked N-acetylglucosamine transferase (SPINDLY family)
LLARLIPSVPLSAAEAHSARTTFDAQLLELETWLQHRTLGLRDSLTVAQQQFFYLSYEEISNRHVLERYRAASVARLAALGHLPAAPAHLPTIYGERASPRLKLGFVSAHVHDHSVFNAILRGWLEHLDHDRFELALFSVGRTRDAMSEAAAACVDHFDSSARSVVDWADAIRDRELDALIYPEIGMNETILGVASSLSVWRL